jgi:hypothetical protein
MEIKEGLEVRAGLEIAAASPAQGQVNQAAVWIGVLS